MAVNKDVLPAAWTAGEDLMETPEDVVVMLRLKGLGWGAKRIAFELGCSRNTVKRYLRRGAWVPYQKANRRSALDGLEVWLCERLRQHRGNADVVRQELEREHGLRVSLRTVERAVCDFRRELEAEQRACVRFETPPGRQLQIDFGSTWTSIGGEIVRVFLFVATLGYSRRGFVAAFSHERQGAWFDGLEAAFHHFGGIPAEVLIDNARALVEHHDPTTREVAFNGRFHAFARYWGFKPRACAPYRARTKGKDERGVGYVKRNAIAGRHFASWAELEAHLAWWMREVADRRIHGTTGELPIERFCRDEMTALQAINGRPPFRQVRVVTRRVQGDGCIDLDTNHYSVPWPLIGAPVTVEVSDGVVRISHAGSVVASHPVRRGRRERAVDTIHLAGIVADRATQAGGSGSSPPAPAAPVASELLRPLSEYEGVAGGGW